MSCNKLLGIAQETMDMLPDLVNIQPGQYVYGVFFADGEIHSDTDAVVCVDTIIKKCNYCLLGSILLTLINRGGISLHDLDAYILSHNQNPVGSSILVDMKDERIQALLVPHIGLEQMLLIDSAFSSSNLVANYETNNTFIESADIVDKVNEAVAFGGRFIDNRQRAISILDDIVNRGGHFLFPSCDSCQSSN